MDKVSDSRARCFTSIASLFPLVKRAIVRYQLALGGLGVIGGIFSRTNLSLSPRNLCYPLWLGMNPKYPHNTNADIIMITILSILSVNPTSPN